MFLLRKRWERKVKVKRLVILLPAFLLLFTSGCWDKTEISEKAFIFTLAVDSNEIQDDKAEDNNVRAFYESQRKKITAIFSIPIPSKTASIPSSDGSGGGGTPGGGKAFINQKSEGENIPDIIKILGVRENRTLCLCYIKLFLLGENLLKDKEALLETLDYARRDPDFNKLAYVAVAKGKMEDIVNIEPKMEKMLASYVAGIFDMAKKTSSLVPVHFGVLASTILKEGNAVLPCIEKADNEVKINNLALIKDYQLLAYMDGKYIRPYACINNKLEGGTKLIEYKGTMIPYEISSSKRRISLKEEGNLLKYTINVEMEGDIEEFYFTGQISEDDILKEIKSRLEESMKLELQETTNYFQEVIGCDYLGLGEYTYNYHNKIYKKYKENWDKAFSKADIAFDVTMNIKRIGISK
ncbi:MAG: Ger(x)C family spore germination protein [Ruminiclostridium sp.]|nr:Ger(x)C family spore germination protein [Ruminiclostridium sp.]